MQKIIHLSLTVAILLAAMGFRVNIPHCADEKEVTYSLFSKPACCCGEEADTNTAACRDMTCAPQQGTVYQVDSNTTIQQAAKFFKEPARYLSFTESIRPAILERVPHFILPPPVSGRFIGILYQTFII